MSAENLKKDFKQEVAGLSNALKTFEIEIKGPLKPLLYPKDLFFTETKLLKSHE